MKHLLTVSLVILIVSLFSPTVNRFDNIHFSSLANATFHAMVHSPQVPNSKQNQFWVVTTAPTNIRTEPSVTAPIRLVAQPESWFPILERKNNWDHIRIGSGQTGWVADWVIQTRQVSNSMQVVHVAPATRLAEGPGTSFPAHEIASSSRSYVPLKVEGFWAQIRSTDAATNGWVPVSTVSWKTADHSALPPAVDVSASPATYQGPLTGKTIVIDPGHGGSDTGAIGTSVHIYERDVNLAVATVLQNKLEAAGANVIMTRTSNNQDVSLAERTTISNQQHADLFISIHQNMYRQDPSVNGTITYYYDKASKKAAEDIENGAIHALSPHQAKSQIQSGTNQHEKFQVQSDDLYVLRNNHQPAVLIEGCFLSNPSEVAESMEPSYQEHLASGIYHGVLSFFGR